VIHIDILEDLIRAWQKKIQALKIEKRRKAEIDRLLKQIEIGAPIYEIFLKQWTASSSPVDKKVSKDPYFADTYRIGIGTINNVGEPTKEIATVMIDLRRKKSEQIFVACDYNIFSNSVGFEVFSIKDGKKFILKKLIPALFPKV